MDKLVVLIFLMFGINLFILGVLEYVILRRMEEHKKEVEELRKEVERLKRNLTL